MVENLQNQELKVLSEAEKIKAAKVAELVTEYKEDYLRAIFSAFGTGVSVAALAVLSYIFQAFIPVEPKATVTIMVAIASGVSLGFSGLLKLFKKAAFKNIDKTIHVVEEPGRTTFIKEGDLCRVKDSEGHWKKGRYDKSGNCIPALLKK